MANKFSKYDVSGISNTDKRGVISENKFKKYDTKGATLSNTDSHSQSGLDAGYGRHPSDPRWARTFRKIDDLVRSTVNGATFGLGDVIAGTMNPSSTINDEINISKRAKEEDPHTNLVGNVIGSTVGFGKLSKMLGKAAPSLGNNTLKSFAANQAVTSGTGSTINSLATEGELNLPKTAMDTALGGVGGAVLQPLTKFISPFEKISQTSADIPKKVKDAAYDLAKRGKKNNIDLTVPEALRGVDPSKSVKLEQLHQTSMSSPKGSVEYNVFDESRKAGMKDAGNRIATILGKGAAGDKSSEAAAKALSNVEKSFRNAAEPYYKASENVIIKGIKPNEPLKKSVKSVSTNKIKMEALKDGSPKLSKNSIRFLDAVKKDMGREQQVQFDRMSDPFMASIIASKSDDLVSTMKQNSPDYEEALRISGAGAKEVDRLTKGPLGVIRDTPNSPKTQASAVFGVKNNVELDRSMEALSQLPIDIRKGMLTNLIESNVASNPNKFASKSVPNDYTQKLVDKASGPRASEVNDILEPAKLVGNGKRPLVTDTMGGPVAELWHKLRTLGSGKTTKMLNDPEMIRRLGENSAIKSLMAATINATSNKATSKRMGGPR